MYRYIVNAFVSVARKFQFCLTHHLLTYPMASGRVNEMQKIFVVLAVGVVCGCAKYSSAVVPVDIPMQAYSNLPCEEIEGLLSSERIRMKALSDQQDGAAAGDAFGVFLIGVPTASALGANKEGELAASKGKVQAMELAYTFKRCQSVGSAQSLTAARRPKMGIVGEARPIYRDGGNPATGAPRRLTP